jgi:alpha-L-fucosidase
LNAKDDPKMEWFNDAKLGIFIHYGIYAVNGTAESWAFYNKEVSYDDYMGQLKGFTASKYNPDAWAELFKEAGAKYAVLTSKHHDGVALWNTKWSKLNVIQKSPAKKDIITPFAESLRKNGLKVGIYYSHLDWSDKRYATVFDAKNKEHKVNPNSWDFPRNGIEDTVKWNEFIRFRNGQLKEIHQLVKPDLFWFDGSWTRTERQWKMKELRSFLLDMNPNVILNSRMKGYGDYETPEQALPILPINEPWEYCMTINDSWGYRGSDTNYKSVNYIIQVLTECISMGGNLLLDIGPKEDGTIPEEQVRVLKEIGKWTAKHSEAIYGTKVGIPFGHFHGPTSLSKDKKTLYLYVKDIPKDDLVIKGVYNTVKKVRLVGSNDTLAHKRSGGAPWMNIPGALLIKLNTNQLDTHTTVIAIDFEEPIKLYRGAGGEITQN